MTVRPFLPLVLLSLGCGCRDNPWGVEGGPMVVSRLELTDDGGRVDWCHESDLIAFDREDEEGDMEVYTIQPDGTGETCVTCDMNQFSRGIRGQPDWHPGCESMLIAVRNEHYEGTRFEHPAWGINDDLWLIAADGSWARQMVETPALGAVLHPHFSDDGSQVFWANRRSTGEPSPWDLEDYPGDENPWDGWFLSVADFVGEDTDGPALEDQVDLYTDEGGFFESHALVDGTIWFSHTEDGDPLVDEGFSANVDGTDQVNHTDNVGGWEEHCDPSPNGRLITFNSSRHKERWAYPPDTALTLELEIFAKTEDGEIVQLTRYGEDIARWKRAVTSDYAWGPDGRHIVSYHVETFLGNYHQFIEVLELDQD